MGAFQFSHVMSPACSPFSCHFVEANQIKMDASVGVTLSSSLKTVNKTAIGKGKYESGLNNLSTSNTDKHFCVVNLLLENPV